MSAMHDDSSRKVSRSRLFLFKPILEWLRKERPKRSNLYGFADPEWSVVVALYVEPKAGSIPVALFSTEGVMDGAITLFPRAGRLRARNARTEPPGDIRIIQFGDEDLFERNLEILKGERDE